MQDGLSGFIKYVRLLTRFEELYILQKSFTQFSDGWELKCPRKNIIIMTYIIIKTFAQVVYTIWYIIYMEIIPSTQKPFLILYVNFGKVAFSVIW